jgi:hypothetical protein
MEKIKKIIKGIGTLNLILALVGVFFLWFNAQMITLYKTQGSLPETYACSVVAATIGECGICGWIKTTKEKITPDIPDKSTALEESEDEL